LQAALAAFTSQNINNGKDGGKNLGKIGFSFFFPQQLSLKRVVFLPGPIHKR